MERYGGSHVLCPRRVLLIYPPRPHPLYLNLSPYPPLDHSYSLQSSRHHCPLNLSQVCFVLLLLPRRPVPLVLVGLVAHAACGNRADLNPLSPQRRGSLVAR
ncbi:hypothetical protein HBI72_246830 [Parastagonospora nodorum]|nr:hypothetical protein HBI72_246830 [Parastagonospora nodorum]